MSKAQIKSIWGLASSLSLDKEDVYTILERETKKDSMRECSTYELNKVIRALILLKGPSQSAAPGMITDAQMAKIKELERILGWTDNPKRLQAFIKKFYKVEKVEWLKFKDASKLIESLKSMVKKMRNEDGQGSTRKTGTNV